VECDDIFAGRVFYPQGLPRNNGQSPTLLNYKFYLDVCNSSLPVCCDPNIRYMKSVDTNSAIRNTTTHFISYKLCSFLTTSFTEDNPLCFFRCSDCCHGGSNFFTWMPWAA